MLNIKEAQSNNIVQIVGVLSELDIEEKVTADKRGYIMGKATIKVEQEVDGEVVENEVPVRMFSMRLKKDGTKNAVYDSILKMKEDFTSLAAADNPSQASRVSITRGQLQENNWVDQSTGQVRNSFQISSNFINKAKADEEQKATFELSGVIGSMKEETDKEGVETGNLLIKFIIIGYGGRAEVVQLIAKSPAAVNHIQNHWNEGDTVKLTGIVNMTYKTVTWEEEQGFGEPIKRTKTISTRELIIKSGSQTGLDEEESYDSDSIKIALDERAGRIAELTNKAKKPAPSKSKIDVGF